MCFVPLDIGSWDAKHVTDDQGRRLEDAYFKGLRSKWLGYMRGLYPLPPQSLVDTTASNLMMGVTYSTAEHAVFTAMNLLSRLEEYHGLCGGKVDIVVGIVPDDWMADSGRTENAFPHAVLIAESASDTILSHEVGHLLKFLGGTHNQDVYGKTVLADPGFLIESLSPLTVTRYPPPLGKVKVVDFMDVDPETSISTWISRQNYAKLMQAVQNRFGSTIKAP